MRRPLSLHPLALLLLGNALSACGADDSGSVGFPIAGGQLAPADTAVVGIVDLVSRTMADVCSGTLIAPNVVLTARHCVSDVEQSMSSVNCGTATVGPPRDAANFFVTTAAVLPMARSGFTTVSEVVVLPGSDQLCGRDLAVLILSSSIPSAVAQPLDPSVDPPQAGLPYSAIGYGGTGPDANDAGVRRRRDGLAIACVGDACNSSGTVTNEFTGGDGVCPGDSGGPALDEGGRVVGVASRSTSTCMSAVYGAVFPQLDFLRQTVQHAAAVGGYEVPAWAAPAAPGTGDMSVETNGGGGCAIGQDRHGGATAIWPLVLLALALAARRRSPTDANR